LQVEQFLGVLDAQQGLGVVGGLGQRSLGGLQVEFNQFLDAFEGLLGQTEEGLDLGFLGGDDFRRSACQYS